MHTVEALAESVNTDVRTRATAWRGMLMRRGSMSVRTVNTRKVSKNAVKSPATTAFRTHHT